MALKYFTYNPRLLYLYDTKIFSHILFLGGNFFQNLGGNVSQRLSAKIEIHKIES
jgi:hypothetical protein